MECFSDRASIATALVSANDEMQEMTGIFF